MVGICLRAVCRAAEQQRDPCTGLRRGHFLRVYDGGVVGVVLDAYARTRWVSSLAKETGYCACLEAKRTRMVRSRRKARIAL